MLLVHPTLGSTRLPLGLEQGLMMPDTVWGHTWCFHLAIGANEGWWCAAMGAPWVATCGLPHTHTNSLLSPALWAT